MMNHAKGQGRPFALLTAADQVKVLINDCGNMGERFEEVDFDEFMIDLATELKCFPPLLFTSTAKYINAEIAHIIEPPDSLKGAVGWLSHMQEKLKAWHKSENSLEMQLRNALLRDDWDAAIALEVKVKSDVEKELLAWAYIMQGNALSGQAELEQDEVLFQRSFKPFEAALKIKQDKHEALSNWGVALSALYHKTKDSNLLGELEAKCRAAEAIVGKANYNLACALAVQGREEETEAQLLRCKADGTLPSAEDLAADKDLEAYWNRDWFQELVDERLLHQLTAQCTLNQSLGIANPIECCE